MDSVLTTVLLQLFGNGAEVEARETDRGIVDVQQLSCD